MQAPTNGQTLTTSMLRVPTVAPPVLSAPALPPFVPAECEHDGYVPAFSRIIVAFPEVVDGYRRWWVNVEDDGENTFRARISSTLWQSLRDHFHVATPEPVSDLFDVRFSNRGVSDFCKSIGEQTTIRVPEDYPWLRFEVSSSGVQQVFLDGTKQSSGTSYSSLRPFTIEFVR